MIDSVQSSQGMFGMQRTPPAPLTDDQKTAVQSILSQYDPKNLSSSDAQSIFKSLREAGVGPSPDLRQTLSKAGFDPQQLRQLIQPQDAQSSQDTAGADGTQAASGHRRHHHHSGGTSSTSGSASTSGTSLNTSALQSLQSILGQYDLSNLTSDQQQSMVQKMNDAGLLQTGYSINLSA